MRRTVLEVTTAPHINRSKSDRLSGDKSTANRSTRLEGRLRQVADLSGREREEMFALMDRHFANLTRANFEADLDEKQWVIELVHPRTGRICGFSTQTLLEQEFDGRPILVLFSGDTIVDPDHWGQNVLAQVWAKLVLSLYNAHPEAELYWFLITNSFRTYRYLPIFFREFYPCVDRPTPNWAAELIDVLAERRYASAYDPATGIVQGSLWSGCRPSGEIAGLTAARRKRDPHVDFFAQGNPGHVRGDELCCLARLDKDNITPAAWKVVERVTEQPAVCLWATDSSHTDVEITQCGW